MSKSAATVEAARRADAFIAAYGRCGNVTQAAKEAGYSPRSAGQQGHRLMKDVEICEKARSTRDAFLNSQQDARERQAKALVDAADDAVAALRQIVQGGEAAGKGAVARVAAATAILDRAGHKPVEKVEQKVELSTDAEAARERLKAKLAGG